MFNDDRNIIIEQYKKGTKRNKWNVKFYRAANGPDALDIIAKEKITIVLTDMVMPGINGSELLNAIRHLRSPLNQIPVILISGSPVSIEIGKFPTDGFAGFVIKPFTEAGLISQIINALQL